jgi:hypothetical protein
MEENLEKQWTCAVCSKPFRSGDWNGCRGIPYVRHRVAAKQYFSMHDNLQICVIKELKIVDSAGRAQTIPGQQAAFIGGRYETIDPEIQEILDRGRPALISEEEYMERRATPELRTARAKAKAEEQLTLRKQAEAKLAAEQQKVKDLEEKLARKSKDTLADEEPAAATETETEPIPPPHRFGRRREHTST